MSPQVQTHSTENQTIAHHSVRRRRRGNILVIVLFFVLIGIVLEYFGVLNLISNFGRRGRPTITLGLWRPTPLLDVPQSYWADPYIEKLTQRGIVRGYPNNEFRPNQPITRAEFATLLRVAFDPVSTPTFIRSIQAFWNSQVVSSDGSFSDVSSNYWAAPAIADVTASGFMNGFPNDEFRPEQPITRANALVAIANALDLKRNTTTYDSLWFYRDAAQISKYAKEQITAATEAGIRLRQSQPPLLHPNKALTRAEAAILINQMIKLKEQ